MESQYVVDKIDGKVGKISEHFADIYEKLYNSVDDVELNKIETEIENKVALSSIYGVKK